MVWECACSLSGTAAAAGVHKGRAADLEFHSLVAAHEVLCMVTRVAVADGPHATADVVSSGAFGTLVQVCPHHSCACENTVGYFQEHFTLPTAHLKFVAEPEQCCPSLLMLDAQNLHCGGAASDFGSKVDGCGYADADAMVQL